MPLLASAIPWVGHEAIRNRGTVGGALCQADPSEDLSAVCAALGASALVRGQPSRGDGEPPLGLVDEVRAPDHDRPVPEDLVGAPPAATCAAARVGWTL